MVQVVGVLAIVLAILWPAKGARVQMKDSKMTACFRTGQSESVYNFGLPDVHGVTRINLSRYRGKVTLVFNIVF